MDLTREPLADTKPGPGAGQGRGRVLNSFLVVVNFDAIQNPLFALSAKVDVYRRPHLNASADLIVCQRLATPGDISRAFAITIAHRAARFFDDKSGARRIFSDSTGSRCGSCCGGGLGLREDHGSDDRASDPKQCSFKFHIWFVWSVI
jgi:hypothetical protein